MDKIIHSDGAPESQLCSSGGAQTHSEDVIAIRKGAM